MAGFSKMSGRNRYKKICFKCAEMVPAYEGFLKSIKGEYFVHHIEECNPSFDMEAFKKNPIQPKSNKIITYFSNIESTKFKYYMQS